MRYTVIKRNAAGTAFVGESQHATREEAESEARIAQAEGCEVTIYCNHKPLKAWDRVAPTWRPVGGL